MAQDPPQPPKAETTATATPSPTPASTAKGWSAVAANASGLDKETLLSTAFAILRAPIQGPVDLALRDSYTGHLKFFGTVAAAMFSLLFVILPNMAATSLGSEARASPASTALFMSVQYALLAILLPLYRTAFSHATGQERSPMDYFKLMLLAGGAASVVHLLAFMVGMVGWAFWTPDDVDESPAQLQRSLSMLLMFASLVGTLYLAAVHARFWSANPLKVAVAFVLIGIPLNYLSGILAYLFSTASTGLKSLL